MNLAFEYYTEVVGKRVLLAGGGPKSTKDGN